MHLKTNKKETTHRKKETGMVMYTLAASVSPDKDKIHSGIKRRLREMRLNNTGREMASFPFYKWAASCGVFLAVFCISYYFLMQNQERPVYCRLLPIGSAEISNVPEELTEPGNFHVKGRTITTLDKSKVSLRHDRFKVRLNELTSIHVAAANHIQLIKGTLFADVEKRSQASEPFTIAAGDLTVVVVGTQFTVDRKENRVTVAVKEGRVRLRAGQKNLAVLSAGEQVIFSGQKIGEKEKIDPGMIASWSQTLIQEELSDKEWKNVMREYYDSRTY